MIIKATFAETGRYRERPLMASDFRVSRGVQNHQKLSDIIYGRSHISIMAIMIWDIQGSRVLGSMNCSYIMNKVLIIKSCGGLFFNTTESEIRAGLYQLGSLVFKNFSYFLKLL